MNFPRHHKNHGIVLVGVLIILVTLTLVALTLTQRNTMDEMMSAAQRDAANAISISESGIEAGFALVEQNHIYGQAIKDDLYQLPGGVLSQDTISGGNFLVTVIDGVPNDGIATLNSVGNYNGSVREIEVMLDMLQPDRDAYAILTSDDVYLSGSAQVNGPEADVHSNSDVDVWNLQSPGIDGSVSASGTVDIFDADDVTGGTVDGAALVNIPHVYPPDYLQYATVILTADCRVMSPGGVQWAFLPTTNDFWHGWKCRAGVDWTLGSNPADGYMDGFYYIEGNIKISSAPSTQWPVTFVTEGNIEISGNPKFIPWGSAFPNDTGDAEANEILFLAGNDIDIRGTQSALTSGIIAAHMEVEMSGNVTHTGSVVAENGLHGMGQEVTTGQAVRDLIWGNGFSGNVTINGSGTGLGYIKKLTATAWRELVF